MRRLGACLVLLMACGDADAAPVDAGFDAAPVDTGSGGMGSDATPVEPELDAGGGAAGTMAADFCVHGGTRTDEGKAFAEHAGEYALKQLTAPCTTGPLLFVDGKDYSFTIDSAPARITVTHVTGEHTLTWNNSFDSACDKPGGLLELSITEGREDLDESLWEELSVLVMDGAPTLLRVKGRDEASTARCTLHVK